MDDALYKEIKEMIIEDIKRRIENKSLDKYPIDKLADESKYTDQEILSALHQMDREALIILHRVAGSNIPWVELTPKGENYSPQENW